VIEGCPDQDKHKHDGEGKDRETAEIAETLAGARGNKQTADAHHDGAEPKNPVREIFHNPVRRLIR